MITAEALNKANEQIKAVDIKGKSYAQVTERVKAFRSICPGGTITTEVLSLENGVVTMKATVTDEDGSIIATGMAQEKESSSFINKTSFIENCETSAVGRALGFAGIGVDGSMASAEELVNAVMNQNKAKTIGAKEQAVLRSMCEKRGLDIAKTFPDGLNLTDEQYTQAVKRLESIKVK